MDSNYLQLFLMINVFAMGAVTVFAVQHAVAHFKPHPHEDEKPHPAARPQEASLSYTARKKLQKALEEKYQKSLDHSVVELEHDLRQITIGLSKKLDSLGNEIVGTELDRYHKSLARN